MSKSNAHASRWGHRALNLALVALGVAVMALLYALVSQHVGGLALPSVGAAPPGQEATGSAVAAASTADEIVQVGVRNGCGENGLAARARGHLVRAGFDVVEVGNYSSFDVDSSLVIDRVGDRAAARRVARAMGIPPSRIRRDVGADYYLDAAVVLGSDYRTLKPFREEQHAAAR